MTSSTRHPVRRWLLVACALTAAALPAQARASQAPATPASTPPSAAVAPSPLTLERFVDRVWVVDASTSVTPGALYVFLSDNVLVVSPKEGTPAVGTWAEDVDGLVMTEKGRSAKIDVLELTADRFRLRVHTPRTPTEITLVPAVRPAAPPAPATTTTDAQAAAPVVTPIGAPYRCGADTFRVAFEGNKAYLTWPDNTAVVLNEITVKDAPASRRTFSDGQLRVVEDTSESYTRVLFARAGFRPRPCTPMR
jgi:hypothetical protein